MSVRAAWTSPHRLDDPADAEAGEGHDARDADEEGDCRRGKGVEDLMLPDELDWSQFDPATECESRLAHATHVRHAPAAKKASVGALPRRRAGPTFPAESDEICRLQ